MDLSRTSDDNAVRSGESLGGTDTLVAPDWRGPVGEAGWNETPSSSGDDAVLSVLPVPEEDPLDAEHPSRRSLRAVWWLCGGVGISLLLGLLIGGRAGTLGIAATLAVAGTFRAVLRGPAPAGLAVRTRGLDVVMYMALAVMIGVLAVVAPIG
ncbi:DUF3017 domain-containing protein [Myceligenerans crystallogenes]|uniref:DUF3017 domain-containing protein n=1 Tax=Myceligenerans crystallogenes TaxID=316335 RepID=A0ABN2N3Y2_9MICO